MGFPTASAEVPASTAPPFGALLAHIAAAGLVAGALSGTWSLLITERAIEPALAIEEARSATGGGDAEEMFSRTTQVLGGLLGAVLAGLVCPWSSPGSGTGCRRAPTSAGWSSSARSGSPFSASSRR
ncbi:MAG: hypothetical protein M3P89_10420 [Actinomycetota bacterium]|nr:hypothetical protein [Actinomycetota bacterium]